MKLEWSQIFVGHLDFFFFSLLLVVLFGKLFGISLLYYPKLNQNINNFDFISNFFPCKKSSTQKY